MTSRGQREPANREQSVNQKFLLEDSNADFISYHLSTRLTILAPMALLAPSALLALLFTCRGFQLNGPGSAKNRIKIIHDLIGRCSSVYLVWVDATFQCILHPS